MTQPALKGKTGKGKTGLRRLVGATRNSLEGLAAAARHESAFRQELLLAGVLVPLGLWLGADGVQRALLAGRGLVSWSSSCSTPR